MLAKPRLAQAERCVGAGGHRPRRGRAGTAIPPGCLAPWGSMVRPSFGSSPQQQLIGTPLRGGGWCERSRPRDTSASELCRPKPRSFRLQKNKGRQSAERRKSWAASSDAARADRGALAFRRPTAALAPAMCRSSIQAALRAMQCAGVTFALASRLSEAPRAPVIMPAGSMPGPPGSGSDEPPPAGTAPAPSVGVTG